MESYTRRSTTHFKQKSKEERDELRVIRDDEPLAYALLFQFVLSGATVIILLHQPAPEGTN